jgi:hypothetical protein
MDHTVGKRAAAGSGAGPSGRPRRERAAPGARLPAEHHGARRKPCRTPAETLRESGGNVRRLPGRETSRPPGETHGTRPETCGGHTGNAQCPPGVNAVGYGPPGSKAAGQCPFWRNAQHAGGPPLNACQVAWQASVPGFTPLSPGWTKQFMGGGRDGTWAGGPQSVPADRANQTDPAAHFHITSSEIANTCSQHRKRRLSIHLRASYLNVISRCR